MAAQTQNQLNFNPEVVKLFQSAEGFDEQKLKELQDAIMNQVAKKTKDTPAKEKRTRRATKEARDPNLPKRPKNAFMLFSESVREEVKADLISKADDGKIRVADVSKACGERWKAMTDEEKQPFVDANTQAKADYEKAMEAYYEEYPDKKEEKTTKKSGASKKTKAEKKTKTTFSTEDGLPTTPEGFSGAYTGYLKGSVKDPETGKNIQKKFKDFNEAVAEAIRLGDLCGGITRTGKGYSLRAGTEVKTNNTASDSAVKAEISWVKGDGANIEAEVLPVEDYEAPTEDEHEMPALEAAQPEAEPEQVEEMSTIPPLEASQPEPEPKQVEEMSTIPPLEAAQPEHEPSPVPEPVPEPEPEKKSKSIPITESDSDSDEDDDDDEKVETDPWEYKGITYYVDTDDDVMTEDGEVIGKRRKKKDGSFTLDEY